MMAAEAEDADGALRALAHSGRRTMLQLVAGGERSATELAEACGMSRPAASQHLKVLREAGLVDVRAKGNQRLYQARAEQLARLRAVLDDFWGGRLATLRDAVAEHVAEQKGRS